MAIDIKRKSNHWLMCDCTNVSHNSQDQRYSLIWLASQWIGKEFASALIWWYLQVPIWRFHIIIFFKLVLAMKVYYMVLASICIYDSQSAKWLVFFIWYQSVWCIVVDIGINPNGLLQICRLLAYYRTICTIHGFLLWLNEKTNQIALLDLLCYP